MHCRQMHWVIRGPNACKTGNVREFSNDCVADVCVLIGVGIIAKIHIQQASAFTDRNICAEFSIFNFAIRLDERFGSG